MLKRLYKRLLSFFGFKCKYTGKLLVSGSAAIVLSIPHLTCNTNVVIEFIDCPDTPSCIPDAEDRLMSEIIKDGELLVRWKVLNIREVKWEIEC